MRLDWIGWMAAGARVIRKKALQYHTSELVPNERHVTGRQQPAKVKEQQDDGFAYHPQQGMA